MALPRLIILGAGLTGLTLAYLLRGQFAVTILEARNRIGGRILTNRKAGSAPVEMGATWFGAKHDRLGSLLTALSIPCFEQCTGGRAIYEPTSTSSPQVVELPPNEEPSFRIAGGSDTLIQALAAAIPDATIKLEEPATNITRGENEIRVRTNGASYVGDYLVSTLPPNLFFQRISCQPSLPENLAQLASETHTWMGESIKVGLRFRDGFWKKGGACGTIFSNVGPVTEMYDHSNLEGTAHALKGFMKGTYHNLSREERRELVIKQLTKYFGSHLDEGAEYLEYVWRQDPDTFVPNSGHTLPHQHNGHPAFRQPFWNGRLLLAGSETALRFPGYMDGAVRSAEFVAGVLSAG